MARGSKMVSNIASIDAGRTGEGLSRQPTKSSPDDGLNGSVIAMLQTDGRRAFSEIAATLGVSEGTIRNRVAGMKQAGMLRIVAIADPEATKYKTDATLGLKIAPHNRWRIVCPPCRMSSISYGYAGSLNCLRKWLAQIATPFSVFSTMKSMGIPTLPPRDNVGDEKRQEPILAQK